MSVEESSEDSPSIVYNKGKMRCCVSQVDTEEVVVGIDTWCFSIILQVWL
jgi:hypothetical protein